jgi:hypothetical protein
MKPSPCATSRVHRPGATFQSYGLDADPKIATASSRRGAISLDIPFYRITYVVSIALLVRSPPPLPTIPFASNNLAVLENRLDRLAKKQKNIGCEQNFLARRSSQQTPRDLTPPYPVLGSVGSEVGLLPVSTDIRLTKRLRY